MSKRFTKVSSNGYWSIKDNQADYKKIWDLTNPQLIEDRLNELNDEVEVCKQAYDEIKSDAINLKEENEQLKKHIESLNKILIEEHSIDERLLDDLYFNQVGGI